MSKIKLMLVDDQSLIREGLSMILSLSDDFQIVGEASNGVEAIKKLDTIRPDIVLMDIRMPKMDGVEATKIIMNRYPHIKIIILTTFSEDDYIYEALKNGAVGYVLKDLRSEEIIKGVKTVYEGNVLLQPEIATKLVKTITGYNTPQNNSVGTNGFTCLNGKYEQLTDREEEIAKLVSYGKSNKEISEILFITEGTVKNNISKILAKLQLRDRTQLALFIKDNLNSM